MSMSHSLSQWAKKSARHIEFYTETVEQSDYKMDDQAWNDLTMERCDLKPEFLCLFLRSHFAGKPVEATTPPMSKIFYVKGELMIIKHDRRFHKWSEKQPTTPTLVSPRQI